MNTKKLFAALSAVLISMAMVSCGGKENEEEVYPDPVGELTGSFSIVNSDGTTFSMDAIKAGYEIGEGTVDITLYGVSFSPRMPMTLDMTVPGVGCAKVAGGYSLSAASVVPLALGRPFENYTITDLTGSLTDSGLSLKMKIGGLPSEYKAGN